MKESKIPAFRDTSSTQEKPRAGILVEPVSFAELNAAWKGADKDLSHEIVQCWQMF